MVTKLVAATTSLIQEFSANFPVSGVLGHVSGTIGQIRNAAE